MLEYADGNNNSSIIGIHNHNDRGAIIYDDNSSRKIKNDLTKSTWVPSAVSSVENKYDRSFSPDGPMAISFENYVRNIFRPGNKLPKISATSISARSMLRIQDLLVDEDIMKTPLEKIFIEYGLIDDKDYLSYSSYYPIKSANSTYGSIVLSSSQNKDGRMNLGVGLKGKEAYSSKNDKADSDKISSTCRPYKYRMTIRPTGKKPMTIGNGTTNKTPLTPYMYAEHPFVRSQDSRIVGSNFVQITSRPKDSFLEKIDRTLAEVRAMPRF